MSDTTLQNTATTIIRVVDLVEYPTCPDGDDADRVFQAVEEPFRNGQNVILCFEGIEYIVPACLASMIGPLLRDYSEEEVRSRLKVINLKPFLEFMVNAVIKGTVEYYQDPEKYERLFEESLRVYK